MNSVNQPEKNWQQRRTKTLSSPPRVIFPRDKKEDKERARPSQDRSETERESQERTTEICDRQTTRKRAIYHRFDIKEESELRLSLLDLASKVAILI